MSSMPNTSARLPLARGPAEAIRDLAKALDRRILLIRRGEGAVWAWLGGRRRPEADELERAISQSWPAQVSLAIGEPADGLCGWRLTHQQARAALPIALRSQQAFIRYSDVALLASILQDDVLATTLRELYLVPLSRARDGGAVLRQTLRAYFTAERNASSAAAALGVSR
jgi:DNA-binding PucR family transcriptional regulator